MTDSTANLYRQGELAFAKSHWRNALCAFAGVALASPNHWRSRLRIADALLNCGRRELARTIYQAVAGAAFRGGRPLVGLVALKMLELLEPQSEDLVLGAAALYGAGCERLALDMPLDPHEGHAHADVDAHALVDHEGLAEDAARAATASLLTLHLPDRLPRIPLLSLLDEDAFVDVCSKLRLRRFAKGEVLIREGERGESFFLLADGEVSVVRDAVDDDGGVTLARLKSGAVLGEMALISDEPRQASVVAQTDVEALEVRTSDLLVVGAHDEGVSRALKRFTRERFLRHLTATHGFFSPLSRADRHVVMESFRVVACKKGGVVIREGEASPGLFLLLSGRAEVTKETEGERVHLATLLAADLCGEMSLVGDQPTLATVTALEDVEALFLGRDEYKATVREHPEVLRYLVGLTDERLRQNRALLGSGLLEDDEHIMV